MKKNDGLDPRFETIFRRGSKTYFNSSIFFPRQIRREVFILYAFVRTGDDLVDAIPQDRAGFLAFRSAYESALASGSPSGDLIIDSFLDLARRKHFDPAWTTAFLDSMEADLDKNRYDSLDETLTYIYGSAEVIGLYMAAIFDLPAQALPSARALGRSMQYINFLRDVAEDNSLGRRYLPLGDSGLPDLTEATAQAHPEAFRQFMTREAGRYLAWQAEAEAGFKLIPKRTRIPVITASHMYNWTARQIRKDPFVVYRRKVKPARIRILVSILGNTIKVLAGF